MRVFPVPGLPLRDPVKGDFVPDEGREVADSPYWRRRLLCQDASLNAPKTTPTSAQAAPVVVIEDVTEVAPAQADDTALATDDSDLVVADGDNAQ
jgi:hypothetical protein